MKCPKCSKKMKIDRKNTSNNPKTGQVYERIIYVCETDDVWITTEIPITDKPNG